MIKSKKQMFIVIGVFTLVLVLVTTTYAFFNYTRTGTANTIKTGRIAFNSEQGTAINLTNMFPIDVTNGIPDDNAKVGTVTIHVTGDTTYAEGVEYLVSAVNVQNTVGTKSLPISIDVAVASNTNNDPATTLGTLDADYFTNRGTSASTSIYKVLAKDTISTNDQLVVGYVKSGATGVDGNIIIRAYLDKTRIAITDTYDGNETDNMGTTTEWVADRTVFTTTEWNSLQQDGVSFQVKVEANEGIWVEEPKITGSQMVQMAITNKINAETNSCNPVWIDDNGTANDESDDITYFSGTNECVDMNYVWYSGKLWRITAIYPDGKMKLVTQNNITTIAFSDYKPFYNKTTGEKSYMFQWLNEDFLDTLYNYQNIIVTDDNTYWNTNNGSYQSYPNSWNYVQNTNSEGMIPTSIAPVGLLSKEDAVKDSIASNGYVQYLNIGYYTYLVSPHSSSLDGVGYNGSLGYTIPTTGTVNVGGTRPAIYLKNNIIFTGDGTINNPYRITIDKNVGAVDDLINTRLSGEYVSIDNKLFRIVGVENNTTKIVSMSILDGGYFASTTFGDGTNNNYLDYRLNNYFYDNLTYKDKLTEGTYYLGTIDSPYNYKNNICASETLDTTKNCTKATSATFKVGLLRYGEMFATQLDNRNTSFWLLTGTSETQYVSPQLMFIKGDGSYYFSYIYSGSSDSYAAYPTMHLRSNVKIVSGTGLKDDPYVIE